LSMWPLLRRRSCSKASPGRGRKCSRACSTH
jgi:hypothetical protein